MPTTFTDNLALNLPEIGASRDTWGALLNDNFTTLDGAVSTAMPIGSVIDFAGPNAPSGWLLCDGRNVSRTTYSDLFAVLGTVWGAGDGSTTFRLPNTPGRSSLAAGTVTDANGNHVAYTFGQLAGAALQPIQQTHLPNYNLATNIQGAHSHFGGVSIAGNHTHPIEIAGAHDHVNPSTGWATEGLDGIHVHSGTTNVYPAHSHSITLPATGTGVQSGSFQATSAFFGTSSFTTDAAGSHQHLLTTDAGQGIHNHVLWSDGAHQHVIDGAGDHQHAIASDGNHQHTVALAGGGQQLPVLSPVIVFNKIIYAGQQAAVTALAASAPSPRTLSAPLRGSH